jgi:7-cyano-7-deazaguanine synthase
MPDSPPPSTTGLLLSGGIDSAVLLHELLAGGDKVLPFYVRTGCIWDECELQAVRRLIATEAFVHDRLEQLVVLEMPLGDLYAEHWSISGNGVPDDSTPDEAVFMPGRNPLLLIKPVLWCQRHGIGKLALATLVNNPFEDATPEFFARFEAMIRQATGEHVEGVRPFAQLTKWQVLERARKVPLELTFSCLSPVGGMHCGRCNKCAERRQAFGQLGLDDPTQYAMNAQGEVIRAVPVR